MRAKIRDKTQQCAASLIYKTLESGISNLRGIDCHHVIIKPDDKLLREMRNAS
jgi:hypothetical protein